MWTEVVCGDAVVIGQSDRSEFTRISAWTPRYSARCSETGTLQGEYGCILYCCRALFYRESNVMRQWGRVGSSIYGLY